MTRKKKSTSTSEGPSKNRPKSRLRNFEDTDGWTHVSRSKKSKSSNAVRFHSVLQHCDMTLSELLDEHARHSRRWESSEACAQLKTQLEGQKSKLGGAITNVICLALGSPSNIHMDRRQDSHVQLAALETIRVALDLKSVPCIMQDPVFDELDKQFLATFNYETREDPDAFDAVSEGSLVYMIHPERSMYSAVLSKAHPTVFISHDLSEIYAVDETDGRLEEEVDPDTQGLQLGSLAETCDIMPFPQLGYTFSGVVVHWRRVVVSLSPS